jgi:hypothetical protein
MSGDETHTTSNLHTHIRNYTIQIYVSNVFKEKGYKFMKNVAEFPFNIYKFSSIGFFKGNVTAVDRAKRTSLCTLSSCPSGDSLSTSNLITSPLVAFFMTPP